MTLSIELSAEEEARLTTAAQKEGLEPEALLRKLMLSHLPTGESPVLAGVIDRSKPPFRQDPRLMGVRFHEDPTTGIDPEDWPEAFQ